MNDEWVKLPKGAQVTVSRDQARAMQGGLGIGGKTLLVFLIIGLFWVIGHSGTKDKPKNEHPRPQTSVTAPAKVGERT